MRVDFFPWRERSGGGGGVGLARKERKKTTAGRLHRERLHTRPKMCLKQRRVGCCFQRRSAGAESFASRVCFAISGRRCFGQSLAKLGLAERQLLKATTA